MIPAFTDQDRLPIGRFQCDFADAQTALLDEPRFLASQTRGTLWIELSAAVTKFRDIRCKIPSIFLSGSFVTGKIDPTDVDAVFLVDFSTIHSPATIDSLWKLVKMLNTRTKVQAFVIPWWPTEDAQVDPIALEYYQTRGKWDDFWQRDVAKPDRNPFLRHHAFPERGYLEVVIDGYH